MTPFTYKLEHVPTGKRYYGVRFARRCDPSDLWSKYFSSSKEVKSLIERDGPSSFVVEVRRTFKTKEAALDWEHKVLRRLQVIKSDRWLNNTDNKAISYESSLKGCARAAEVNRGRKQTAEHRQKRILALVGRARPVEVRAKVSQTRRQKFAEGTLGTRRGYKNSPEVIEKYRQIALSRPTIACEHCQLEVTKQNYARWHGQNCKEQA